MDILNMILSDFTMVIIWGGLISFSTYMALCTKAYRLSIFIGCTIPMFIFHLYGLFNIWGTKEMGHAYSRLAQLIFVIGLIVSLWVLCRSWRNERDNISNF